MKCSEVGYKIPKCFNFSRCFHFITTGPAINMAPSTQSQAFLSTGAHGGRQRATAGRRG